MMKKLFAIFAIVLSVALVSSCADRRNFITAGQTIKAQPYGIFNEETHRTNGVKYEVSFGSVAMAVIFIETIIVPIYIVGWDLFEPVALE